ncbi:MAG: dihydropyrimidinase, partial [Pseudolabrys sp.]
PRKGSIAIGADADLVIWDAAMEKTVTDEAVVDRTGYSPSVGRTIRGWPRTVVRRGEVIVEDNALKAKPGSGMFLRQDRAASGLMEKRTAV